MPLTSVRIITDSKTTVASKAPNRYFTQSGVVGWGADDGGGAGGSCGS